MIAPQGDRKRRIKNRQRSSGPKRREKRQRRGDTCAEKGGGCQGREGAAGQHRTGLRALPGTGESVPSSRTPPAGPRRAVAAAGAAQVLSQRAPSADPHFKHRRRARRARGPAQHRAGRAGGSCPRENTARIPRRRPRHPARELPGTSEGAGGERAAVRAGEWGRGKACHGNSAAAHPGRPRRLPRAGPRRPPPPRGGGGARREGRGGGQRGDSGRAPIRGGPSRALPGAVCRRPPGLRREPIRGRLPARGAEGTQERRGRRSLPP